MKTIKNQAAQGDVFFQSVSGLPADAIKATPGAAGWLVAHSETGHHHVVADVSGTTLYETGDPLICYLQISEGSFESGASVLEHLRSFHTHESVCFPPGIFKVTRQQERAGSSWVRAQD
jgi:hypothetical protein